MNSQYTNILKLSFFILASVFVLPLIVGLYVARLVGCEKSFFQGSAQLLSIVPFRIGDYFRSAFYKHVCNNVDHEITIGFLTLFSHRDIDIHKNVYIGSQCNIGSCFIDKDCLIGSGVHILSGKNQHIFTDINTPLRNQGGVIQKIRIGEDCWIGNNATIMADVGAKSIIAAGSVVVNEIEPNTIVAGNPARNIKSR